MNLPQKATTDHVRMLYELLGSDAVMLPLPLGTKSPRFKDWTNLTLEETQTQDYQKRLRQGNIGVIVGQNSNGLCSIDCDSDAALNQFLALNPQLRETLITKGQRGGNVWVKIKGAYPSLKNIKDFGEWRSTGGQTVVWGVHPEGLRYRFIKSAKVLSLGFSEINWPPQANFQNAANIKPPTTKHSSVSPASVSESCSPVSAVSPVSAISPVSAVSLYNIQDNTVQSIEARIQRDALLEQNRTNWLNAPKNAALKRLYEQHIDRFFTPQEGQRNHFIVEATPKLFYAMAPSVALKLLLAFYDIHCVLFRASREQHLKECEAMLSSLEPSFVAKLTPDESRLYSQIPEPMRPAFRIFRDLSLRDDPTAPRGKFFMSCAELAQRTDLNTCVAADRVLKKFIAWGLITLLEKGARWTAGAKSRAGLYAWRLMPKVTDNASPPNDPVSAHTPREDDEAFPPPPDLLDEVPAMTEEDDPFGPLHPRECEEITTLPFDPFR